MQARDSCVVACAVAMKGLHPSARLGVERETHTTMALRAGPNAFDHGSSLGSASRQAMRTHAHLLAARTSSGLWPTVEVGEAANLAGHIAVAEPDQQ